MANPQHIKWLLEGVEAWNTRRKQQDFKPDLSDVDLRERFRDKKGLNKSDLLPLTDIDLSKADLRETGLYQADLRGAKFVDADMRGANLSWSTLKDANLISAKLEKTKLHNSDLINANMANTKPWKAVLFPHPDEIDVINKIVPASGIKTSAKNVGGLINECNKLRKHYKKYPAQDIVLYFRGESNKFWELYPPVMRKSEGKSLFRDKEGEMLVDLMARQPEAFNDRSSALAHWVFSQHHGLKTRLIDITRNPIVALFYACGGFDGQQKIDGCLHIYAVPRFLVKPFNSDAVSIIANFARLSWIEQELLLGAEVGIEHALDHQRSLRRLYHLIRQEKPFFDERIDPRDLFRVFVIEPQQSFERIRAQSGAFLISAFHERFERSEILRQNPEIPIYDHYILNVPKAKKESILDELRMLNITRETLFPGLDESAKAVTQRHFR